MQAQELITILSEHPDWNVTVDSDGSYTDQIDSVQQDPWDEHYGSFIIHPEWSGDYHID